MLIYNPSKEMHLSLRLCNFQYCLQIPTLGLNEVTWVLVEIFAAATQSLPWIISFLGSGINYPLLSIMSPCLSRLILRLSHFKLAQVPTPYGSLQGSYGPLNLNRTKTEY